MKILTVKLQWFSGEKLQEKYEAQDKVLDSIGVQVLNKPERYSAYDQRIVSMTGDQYIEFITKGYTGDVLSSSSVDTSLVGIVANLQHLTDRIETLSAAPDRMFNEKVEVQMPGLGLLGLNRTMLCEDYCSDSLQSRLDEGWRIIAACPQPNSRRPDYVLGRYDPSYESESQRDRSSAARGKK